MMLASGFAGLGYQIVWTQQCALWLGHEAAAVLAVITAFFGGLALGAWALWSRIELSPWPERWYAACEAVIAVWSLLLAVLLDPLSQILLRLTGEQPDVLWQGAVTFLGTWLVLLPATVAMGATLPAMSRMVDAQFPGKRSFAALYAANTFGAVIGVLATAFWLVPDLGLVRTAVFCAALNVVCAAVALHLRGKRPPSDTKLPTQRMDRALLSLLATGALGIGYEVLVVRVLSQVAEDTVYTWALLLAVYLAGTALGATAWQRWGAGSPDPHRLRHDLLLSQAAACLVGLLGLWGAEAVRRWVQPALGGGMAGALAAEATMALVAFALPPVVMGALFSHLCAQAQSLQHGVGRAMAFNTLGAATAPLLFGVLLAPALGPKLALLMIVAGYLALAGWRWPSRQGTRAVAAAWCLGAAVVGLVVAAPPLAFVDIPEGGRVVSYRDGTMAAVSVVEDAQGVRRLRINNRQQEGSSATRFADARQALLPLLMHPAPRRALFLGLGTGVTATAAAEDSGLQVDAVELLPEVIEASAHFAAASADTVVQPRWRAVAADARRYVRTTASRYDVIVADNFHPARSGSGALYTVEHFAAVRERLSERGLFCQWLPLHQLDVDTVRIIVRSFLTVNPNAYAVLATNSLETPVLGLVARRDGGRFEARDIHDRLARATTAPPVADFGLADTWALHGSFVAGPSSLAHFAADAPLNTDDHPVVAYRAPRITYAPDSRPRDRLLELLHQWRIEPEALVDADATAASRLSAYWRARQRYLEVGQAVQPSADARQMLAQVREPLLAVMRLSPDFRPAYDPLLRMAEGLARTDLGAAQALLHELSQLQPQRSESHQALRRLSGASP